MCIVSGLNWRLPARLLHAGRTRDRRRARGRRGRAPRCLQLQLLGGLQHCVSSAAAPAPSPPASWASSRRSAAAARPHRRGRHERRHADHEAATSGGGQPPASRGRAERRRGRAPPSRPTKFFLNFWRRDWRRALLRYEPRVGDVPCCVSRGMLPPGECPFPTRTLHTHAPAFL
jgi:hypothetical protein